MLTVQTLPILGDVLVGHGNGVWFVVSRRYDGVISYADFTGLSVAAGLKELAKCLLATMNCDAYGVVNLRQRLDFETNDSPQDIGVPLTRNSRAIWEFYRGSVKATAKLPDGSEIAVIAGDPGDSSKRLEIDGPLITSGGMASAVASAYASYLGAGRRQEEVTIVMPDEPVRVMDVVRFEDSKWLVTSVSTDLKQREQALRLFEVI
jgi:hypothetical protein